MKKGAFYILLSGYNTQKVNGYIFETACNRYGIHNRITDSSGRLYAVTDLASGICCGDDLKTLKAAENFIKNRPDYEKKITEQHNDPKNEQMQKALAAIAEAYQANPITPEKSRPVKYGYIVETYNTADGITRAQISPATHPNYIYMDIPESDLAPTMKEIKKTTPKAYFLDKESGEEIVLLSAKNPEPKKNRIPRKFYKIYITMLTSTTSAGTAGTRAVIFRDEYGRLIEETENGKRYLVNLSILRSAELTRINKIETEAPAATQEAPTTPAESEAIETPAEATREAEEATQDAPRVSAEYMERFLKEYGKQYRALYDAEEDPTTAAEADSKRREYCAWFDGYSQTRPAILAEYIRLEGDYISSDREAAAFMLALEAIGSPEEITAAAETPTTDADRETTTPPAKSTQTATETATAATSEETPTRERRQPENGTAATTAAHTQRTTAEAPQRPANTPSHTDTHRATKSPYKAKYKAPPTYRTRNHERRKMGILKNPVKCGAGSLKNDYCNSS